WNDDFLDQDLAGNPTVIKSVAAAAGTAVNPVATLVFRQYSGDSYLDNCRVEAPISGGGDTPLHTAAVIITSTGTVRLERNELVGMADSGQVLNAGLYVSNSSPVVEDCVLRGGETSLADPDTVSGSIGAVLLGAAAGAGAADNGAIIVEDCRISAGASNAGSYGVYVRDVASLKLRRNMIYGSENGSRVGVYLDAATVPLDGVLLMANIIMPTGTAAGGGHYGIHHIAGDDIVSKPLIVNNTVYAGGQLNSAFNNAVAATGASRPILINNIFQAPLGGYAVQEQTLDPSTDPQVLRNNNLFGDGAHYYNGGVSSSIITEIENMAFIGDANYGGNQLVDCTTGFVGGALPATLTQFLSFDWNLVDADLKTTGYNLSLDPASLLGTALDADDLFDFAGNPLSAGGDWPIGALATP
ncbi:MAG: hypothetical protein KKC64_02570, partial [Spirochaetes bacterium]|nr:hypothetical protein [Spirochaetota bacterium]